MHNGPTIARFEPIHLKLEGIGPFRNSFELPLLTPEGDPANFFLIVSRNGYGKTSVLEAILSLMCLLGLSPHGRGGRSDHEQFIRPELLDGSGRAQLDVRVTLEDRGKSTVVVMSLCCGAEEPIRILTPSLLAEAQADSWLPLTCTHLTLGGGYKPYSQVPLGRSVLDAIRSFVRAQMQPSSLFDERFAAPTALFFPADRRVVRPPEHERSVRRPDGFWFRTAHRFGNDGESWATSIDGLLVWLEWLDHKRFEEAQSLINDVMYRDSGKRLAAIDRTNLSAIIQVDDGNHQIDRLSHGERALMHLLLRSACHMAGSTLLIIDELDIHLHPKWQFHFMRILKEWVAARANLTVIASTHQADLIEAFQIEEREVGVRKGGYMIDISEL